MPHRGTYMQIVPHERIVFSWELPGSDEDSTVTLTFAPVDGGTRVTFVHERLPDRTVRDSHAGGWLKILDALDRVAA